MISLGPSIAHLADFTNGYPFKPEDLGTEGLPVIRIRQLLDSSVEPDRAAPPPRAVLIADGDLVFSWSGSLAVRRWDRGPALLNQHLFRVDPRPGIERGWLRYVLVVAVAKLAPLMHGSAMTHITLDMLRAVTVSVPSDVDQRRIADFLDAETAGIDALIAKKRRMIELLRGRTESLASAAMEDLSARFSRAPLASLASVRVSNVDKLSREGEAPVALCNYTDVYYHRQIHEDMEFMAATATRRQVAEFRLSPGDVLITKDSETADDIGVPALVVSAPHELVLGYHLALLRPVKVSGPFLYWALRDRRSRDALALGASGVTRFGLRQDTIRKLSIPAVPREVQEAVVARLDATVSSAERLIRTLTRQIELLEERRQSLVTAAITGQLAVFA